MKERKGASANQREYLELYAESREFINLRTWEMLHHDQMEEHIKLGGRGPLIQILERDPLFFQLAMKEKGYCEPYLPAKKCYLCYLWVNLRHQMCSRRCNHCKVHYEWRLKEAYGEWIENMPFRLLTLAGRKSKRPRVHKERVTWQWFVTMTLADPVDFNVLEGKTLGRIPYNWTQMGWATAKHRYDEFIKEIRFQMVLAGGDPTELMVFSVMEMQKRGVPHHHMLIYHPTLEVWPRASASGWLWKNAGRNLVERYRPDLGGRFYLPKYLVKGLDGVEFMSEGVMNPRPFSPPQPVQKAMLANVAHGDWMQVTLAASGIVDQRDPTAPNDILVDKSGTL
jgi:hypothetical protein